MLKDIWMMVKVVFWMVVLFMIARDIWNIGADILNTMRGG